MKTRTALFLMPILLVGCAILPRKLDSSREPKLINMNTILSIKENPCSIFIAKFEDNRCTPLCSSPLDNSGTSEPGFFVRIDGLWHSLSPLISAIRKYNQIIMNYEPVLGVKIELIFEPCDNGVWRIKLKAPPDRVNEVKATFACVTDEYFYGFGSPQNGSVNQRGKSVRMWVNTSVPDESCYIPYFISSRNYSMYFDTYSDGYFDMAETYPNMYQVQFADNQLDFYIIPGENPADIILKFAKITGLPQKLPRWAIPMWKWRGYEVSEESIYEDAITMRRNDIPCNVIVLENPWQTCQNSFNFDTIMFPNPKRMLEDIHLMGYRILFWTAPFIEVDCDNYSIAGQKGYFAKDKQGKIYEQRSVSFIDYTNAKAFDWWQNSFEQCVKQGFDGAKLDRGQDIKTNSQWSDGSSGSIMNNKIMYYASKNSCEALKTIYKDDFVLFTRGGSNRSQGYTNAVWSGKYDSSFDEKRGLPAAILAMQNMAVTVFPYWGSDIGGYDGNNLPEKECFIRWLEFGTFSPLMIVGGIKSREPWNTEFFDDETQDIFKFYSTMRAELIPYIEIYSNRASETGLPIAYPMFVAFPDDKAVHKAMRQYMFGDSLLVAPVCVEGATQQDIYLPSGEWYSFWGDPASAIFNGPCIINVFAPLDAIPVFVKAPAIIPLEISNNFIHNSLGLEIPHLLLDVFPSSVGGDEFDNYFYWQEKKQRVYAGWNGNIYEMELPDIDETCIIRVATSAKPYTVVDSKKNRALTWANSDDDFNSYPDGCYYDDSEKKVYIKVDAFEKIRLEIEW